MSSSNEAGLFGKASGQQANLQLARQYAREGKAELAEIFVAKAAEHQPLTPGQVGYVRRLARDAKGGNR